MLGRQLALWLVLCLEPSLGLPDDGCDLASFLSRPEIRPPLFNIKVHLPDRVAPGYWFLTPYVDFVHERYRNEKYSPAQVGPHIFDGNGSLIWSGVDSEQRSTFDFKVADYNGSPHLTYILDKDEHGRRSRFGDGIILDSSYEEVDRIHADNGGGYTDIHEFNLHNSGTTALMAIEGSAKFDLPSVGQPNWTDSILTPGLQEVDVSTGEIPFDWKALDHIAPSESTFTWHDAPNGHALGWDWFHMNSIDKNEDGNYLISARHTNTIYSISGLNGTILWRLGGNLSDFALDGFIFSGQHDARFREDNNTHTTISFLNNASNGRAFTSNTSSAMIVALDKRDMTARLVRSYPRPDGDRSDLRGNVQILSNGNVFVNWGADGYISEFTADGELVMEAQYRSERLEDYRGYKFEWSGTPSEEPVLKSAVYGAKCEALTTVMHVSWNGATEVASWSFYGTVNRTEDGIFLGSKVKTGFETMLMADGYFSSVYAEAIGHDGAVLGKSDVEETSLPSPGSAHAWMQGCAAKRLGRGTTGRIMSMSLGKDVSGTTFYLFVAACISLSLFAIFGRRLTRSTKLHQKHNVISSG